MPKNLIFIVFLFVHYLSYSQQKFSLQEIAKIKLKDAGGGLLTFFQNNYEIVNEDGKWTAYLTHKKEQKYAKPGLARIDSSAYKLIKILSVDSINSFLKAISVIKPKFNAADFGINVQGIARQVNEKYFKDSQAKANIFDSFFNTKAKLNQIITDMQKDEWTDDGPYNSVTVFMKNGDSTQVISTRQVDFMLPWKINNVDSYDMSINKFFLYATDIKIHRMSGAYFLGNFERWVNAFYARYAFGLNEWKTTAPENFKYIQQYFDIIKVTGGGNYSGFSLHPKRLNRHVIINGGIDIYNRAQVENLSRYVTDTLSKFLKNKAFMMDSCLAKAGCSINFADSYGASYKKPFFLGNNYLYQLNFDESKFMTFSIKSGERIEDDWVALPNGTYLLTAYLDDYAVGVSPAYIKKDGAKRRKFVFKIFSNNGKLLREFGNN